MAPEEMTADQLKANAEYYRKLNQQLIQKDNIIKLLQLKLKNLETDLARETAAGEPAGPDDDGERRRPRRARGERDAEREPDLDKIREMRELTSRIDELEKAGAQTTAELEKAREEIGARDRMIAELKARKTVAEPAPPSRDLERLKAQLAERDREHEKLKEEFERLKAEPRWAASQSDPILKEQITHAEQDALQAREEAIRLKAQVAELTAKLEQEPQSPHAAPTAADFSVVKAMIDLLQRADELVVQCPKEAEASVQVFQATLSSLARAAGVERTRTVGHRFDPKLHQAVEMLYSSEHPHSTILSEVAPGYSAAGVVVRLADVILSLNPNHCPTCDKIAPEGSRFCHVCGARVLGREKEGIRILDERAICLSQVEMGVAQEVAGRLDQARIHFSKALSLDPAQPKALAGLARVAELEGRWVEALEFIERILAQSLDPQLIRAKVRIRTKIDIVDKLKDLS